MQDFLIHTREALLALALGFDPRAVLNPQHTDGAGDKTVAAELKEALNAFKAHAMDAGGRHVDYARLAGSPAYTRYRAECSPKLARFNPGTLESRAEQLAFWINLYNALILDAVIRFGVKKSVTEGFAGVLRFFRRAAYNVGGVRFSAEDIEQGVLRGNRGNPYLPGPQFGHHDPRRRFVLNPVDPRIHFALNCASCSCPPVGVYEAGRIERQLDMAARNFIAQEVRLDNDNHTLHLSPIFRWYAVDFGGEQGIIEFICRYLPKNEARRLRENRQNLRLRYTPYDWQLNH